MTIIEYFDGLYNKEREFTNNSTGTAELEAMVFTWRTTKELVHMFYAWVEMTNIDIDTTEGSQAIEDWINEIGGEGCITPNTYGWK